ncbi:hypothetical protein LU11_gp362 [Pseudomonas phage Lu11]|uniref:hypothetical protein n=1 Tax=Pseudomonas phage Lu11 TaxID=1161927 RepID=UPI00025F18C7|nr:hypothetical protein LU11_gp362 [Pseudomonas phage Lu11]AFH14893.1 hypothetical protein Lu11_0355 [Pseudomonas phage Lu11]
MTQQYSQQLLNITSNLIKTYEAAGKSRLRMSRLALASTVDSHMDNVGLLKHTTTRTNLRNAMRERGYKIQIGSAVFISRLPVTNVDESQWPALIDNICNRLVSIFEETDAPFLRLSPAKFRDIATIWPADNAKFNEQCSEAMRKHHFNLTFRMQYIDMRPAVEEPKQEDAVENPTPLAKVMNGRSMLGHLLSPRRTTWRRGFTYALTVNVKDSKGAVSTLDRAIIYFPDSVVDENGVTLTYFALNSGDVVLTNNAGLLQFQNADIVDSVYGSPGYYKIQLGITHL